MNALTDVQNTTLILNNTLATQRATFIKDGPPTLALRRTNLDKLRGAVLSNKTHFEDALIADFGNRSRHETAIMEIMTVIQGIDYLKSNLRKFMRPQRRHVPLNFQPARAYVTYQPLGVIGIMAPWNFPVSLSLMPLATAIAAGNRAMIKPSEITPVTSALLEKILSETFSNNEVAVFQGDASMGIAFSKLDFDHLFFTGSTLVGRHVMKAASENLVPVTLELGGKSPVLVAPDYPIEHAARQVAHGKLANCGQICVAPDYMLIHESQVDRFVESYDTAVKVMYPDGPLSDQYTSIINENHFKRISSLVEDARTKNAKVLEVGIRPHEASRRVHTLAPTLLINVSEDMNVMQEEIFGPVLPVVTYRDIDDAIAYINARPRPLALYFFGDNEDQRHNVLTRTTSGNISINTTIMHYALDDLPFGGIGSSGMGAYHGVEGFRSMSHAKGTLVTKKWNISSLLVKPPFGPIANFILKTVLR
ncbi:aldehyde dehydrogenase (NAD+) [Methylophilaceae bacterium]|nr:aldehyde dehydrogenase (NAD+) [Methylophilaceae bacterium]